MNDFVDSIAYWLADYYLATSLLFAAALVAMRLCRQPVKRLAVAKASLVAMAMLAAFSAFPGWSVVSLGGTEAERVVNVPPAVSTQLPSQLVAPPPSVEPANVPAAASAQGLEKAIPTKVNWQIRWLGLVVAIYTFGCTVVVVWLAAGVIAATRLKQRAEALPEAHWTSVGTTAGLERLQISRDIDVPVALGLWRPCVLLPRQWIDLRTARELSTVLAHESAHIRNGDLMWQAASRVLLILLWAQPLYWWLRRQMRLDQETLADAAAAELSSRTSYAEQLVAWARAVPPRSRPVLASAVGLWESPSQLRRRVSLLLDEHFPILPKCSSRMRWLSLVVCGVTAIGLSMVTVQPTLSQMETPPLGAVSDNQPETESNGGISHDPLALPVAADELAGVVEDESGKPLAGVTVDAWTWFPGNETTTDVDGRFSLKGLDMREPVELQFTKAGFCPRLFVAEPVGKPNWVVRLNSRTYLEGRVLDLEGRPVAGINLRATRGPFETAGEVWTETETDSDGRYRIYLEPDTYELRVRRPGVGVARHEKVVVRENDRREFDLQLEPGPTFRAA